MVTTSLLTSMIELGSCSSTTHGNLHTLSGYPSPVEKGGVMGEQETFLSEFGSPSGLFSLLFPFFLLFVTNMTYILLHKRKEPKHNNLASRDMSFLL